MQTIKLMQKTKIYEFSLCFFFSLPIMKSQIKGEMYVSKLFKIHFSAVINNAADEISDDEYKFCEPFS